MKDCVFCKIVKGDMPADIVITTANLIVFKDINPKTPVHLLIAPKKHIQDIRDDKGVIWSSIGKTAVKIAKKSNLTGFRLTHNAGSAAMVPHMHVHFLGDVSAKREI